MKIKLRITVMQNLLIRIKSILLILFIFVACSQQNHTSIAKDMIVVGGDSKVLIVEFPEHENDTVPRIVWSWDAHLANDLPFIYRTRRFNSVDDCKITPDKKHVMVSSSSGAIAMISIENKNVTFLADVPNAHSIELLPDNKIVAAASTSPNGNKIMLFDLDNAANTVDTDSLYSAHGVVWDEDRNSLFALGYDVLREYKIQDDQLNKINEWKIPGVSGHDLMMAPDKSGLFMTEHTGAWFFQFDKMQFSKLDEFPDAENIKSINKNDKGQFVYTVPEESWWTFHVSFYKPSAKLSFPNMKVYKVRLFDVDN